MKSSCCSLPHSLRIAIVLAFFLPFAAGTAQAENPFKFLGAKAKQGLYKVKQVVHPRRIGAALKNLKPAPLKPAPRVTVRPVNPSDYPDATLPSSGGHYVDGSLPPNRPNLSGPSLPPSPPPLAGMARLPSPSPTRMTPPSGISPAPARPFREPTGGSRRSGRWRNQPQAFPQPLLP